MAQHQCPLCLALFDTGEILLRKDLRQVLNPKTTTGHSLCPACTTHKNNGFIGLVETRDANNGRTTVGLDVPRTGNYAHLRREVFEHVFNVPCPEMDFIFVEPGVLEKLQALQAPEQGTDQGTEQE
jgi:hypothetical protein